MGMRGVVCAHTSRLPDGFSKRRPHTGLTLSLQYNRLLEFIKSTFTFKAEIKSINLSWNSTKKKKKSCFQLLYMLTLLLKVLLGFTVWYLKICLIYCNWFPTYSNLYMQTKEGKRGKSRAFELTCVFANSANLLLSSWERACVYWVWAIRADCVPVVPKCGRPTSDARICIMGLHDSLWGSDIKYFTQL